MARNRSRGTLVDYLVAAIEPALIMIMVGSLMFFLLDMSYTGDFVEQLRWILFWFVLGIVLITRVSMQIGSSLAKAYGVALGGAVALVASKLTGFQPILLVILGIVWWATHKLTYDCTLLDEDQDAGVGLLQETGLDPSTLADTGPPPPTEDSAEMDASLLSEKSGKKSAKRDADDARRPNAPGVWLIYFTLASLPLFGLGQWLVPAVEEDRRGALFVYFLAYISSGMGLLLATSFLNLRRYLRQRKLKMPGAMTATWLTTGAVLIIGLTVVAAALPLPGTGWSVVRGSTHETSDLRASRLAVLKDGGAKGEGAGGQKNDPNAAQQTSGKGKGGGKSGPGNAKTGAPRGKSSKSGASGKKGAARQDESADKKGQTERNKDADQNAEKDDQKGNEDDQKASEKTDDQSSKENQSPSDAANAPPQMPSLPFQAPSWLRWLLIAAGAVALIYGLFRYGTVLLDIFRALLASLLGGLFIEKREKRVKESEAASSEPVMTPRPFAAFADPFSSGLAQNFSPNDLVIYSFEALEAWASEHNLSRSPHETPTEFVQRLGEARADLRQDATRLAGYFVTIVYGQKGFKAEVLPPLRQFWRALQGMPA
jgi:Domain of unknown function (DUF4129)